MINECYGKKLKVKKAWSKNCRYYMVIITLQNFIKDQGLKGTRRDKNIICLDGRTMSESEIKTDNVLEFRDKHFLWYTMMP